MDKLTALRILIARSPVLTAQVKKTLNARIGQLSNHEVDALGRFLAVQKKTALRSAQKAVQSLDEISRAIEKLLNEPIDRL